MPNQLAGVATILVTPRDNTGDVSESGVHDQVRFLMENGLTGDGHSIVLTVSIGECASLTPNERRLVWEAAIAEAGHEVAIIAGIIENHPDQCIAMAETAKELGADGVMILPPHYWKPSEASVEQFFDYILPKISLPIILYNDMLPVSQVDFSVDFVSRLVDRHSNIIGIKECTPNIVKLNQLCVSIGDHVDVLNGWGEFREPYAAMAGCSGFISGIANFAPKQVVSLWDAIVRKDYNMAQKIREHFRPFFTIYQKLLDKYGESAAPAIIKAGAQVRGLKVGPTKLPAVTLLPQEYEDVQKATNEVIMGTVPRS